MFYISNQRKGNSTTWTSDPILNLQHWKLNRSLQGETRVPMKSKHFGLAPEASTAVPKESGFTATLCSVFAMKSCVFISLTAMLILL